MLHCVSYITACYDERIQTTSIIKSYCLDFDMYIDYSK